MAPFHVVAILADNEKEILKMSLKCGKEYRPIHIF